MTSRPSPELALRDHVLRRDGYRCMYCGQAFPDDLLTLDHVEPRMRGGDNSPGNLVAACRPCNERKGNFPAWAYLAERQLERENFLRHGTGVWPRLRRAIEEAADRAARARRRR